MTHPSISPNRLPIADRGPLRVMFMLTSMPVGGAETLVVNLVRGLDPDRCLPEVCCLKKPGPLGAQLAQEFPVHSDLLKHKFDLRVLPRLFRLLRRRRIDAVITVGAGDKMFWGRLAAWRANVPVVLSALHSTGWPDRIGWLNRRLTPITDAFIGVACDHGQHLVNGEGFPDEKVRVIPNGVDVQRFRPQPEAGQELRVRLNIPPAAPVVGLVAALRPEKNHELFLEVAEKIRANISLAHFVLVGDGPERPKLTKLARQLRIDSCVHFLGTRNDIPELLSMLNVFLLTSDNEANPVSILEALSCELPVVATNVGSVSESVENGITGFLVPSDRADALSQRVIQLLLNPSQADEMGKRGRQVVVTAWSLDGMVAGYQDLIQEIYQSKVTERLGSGSPKQLTAVQDCVDA